MVNNLVFKVNFEIDINFLFLIKFHSNYKYLQKKLKFYELLAVDACYATHLLYSSIKKTHKVQNVEK